MPESTQNALQSTVDLLLDQFDAGWREGRSPSIEAVLSRLPATSTSDARALLLDLVSIDLEYRWRNRSHDGDPPLCQIEDYCERFPELGPPACAPLQLIAEEYRSRHRWGDRPSHDDYLRRFEIDGTQLRNELLRIDRELVEESGGPAAGGDRASTADRGSEVDTERERRPASSAEGEADNRMSRSLGPYRLQRRLGQGAMGTVYLADDRRLQRQVALKIPHLIGSAEAELKRRFVREAQSAAQLQHPCIVRVYEAAEHEGQPYLVSEYIAGETLSEWIVREDPTPRETARLCYQLADALKHAHQMGVIHRDLKPANVLMDPSGAPHITDFSLAKWDPDGKAMTVDGHVLGTPAYMPPEQARGESHRADPRSDVYSLGALMYELLTGEPPFRGGATAVLEQVRNNDPPRPRRLNPRISVDLETICLKCLEKRPDHRYASADAVLDELQRFLDGRPILARPLTRRGYAWRWVARHPGTASGLGAVVLSLLVALIAAWTMVVRVSHAQRRAEVSFEDAHQAVDWYFTEVSEETLLDQPGLQPLRKRLLDRALAYYRKFLSERGADPQLRHEAALAHFRIGRLVEDLESPENAIPSYNAAREIQQRLIGKVVDDREALLALSDTCNALGRSYHRLQQFDEAKRAYDEALQIRQILHRRDSDDGEFRRKLANVRMNHGLLAKDTGQLDAALEHCEQAHRIRLDTLDSGGGSLGLRRDFAGGCYNLANLMLSITQSQPEFETSGFEQTEEYLRLAIETYREVLDDNPADLTSRFNRAMCVRRLGDVKSDTAAAYEMYQEAARQLESLYRNNPQVASYQRELARCYHRLGLVSAELGESEGALQATREAMSLYAALLDSNAEDLETLQDLTEIQLLLAKMLLATGEVDRARTLLIDSRRHVSALSRDATAPSISEGLNTWEVMLQEIDELLRRTGSEEGDAAVDGS